MAQSPVVYSGEIGVMRCRWLTVFLLLMVLSACHRQSPERHEHALKEPIQHAADSIQWQAAPPAMPTGSRIAVLEGDPKGGRLFTLRVKLPAGTRLEPHWHPRDERVTVLSGQVGVGFGREFRDKDLRYFAAGSYYVNPAGHRHYLHFPVETAVQITGIGPWETHFVQAAGNP